MILELTQGLQKELNGLICNELIGSGTARQVWSSIVLPNSVVKIETAAGSFQNVKEWDLWQDMKGDPNISKWLAPCEWISACGSVLIMAKTTPCKRSKYPDKLPMFLTDTKFQNYGMLGKRFVCHDYGSHVANTFGCTTRMRSAHWWDVDNQE